MNIFGKAKIIYIKIILKTIYFVQEFDKLGINFYKSNKVILGGIFMKNYDIFFDRQANRILYTKAYCNSEENKNFKVY